jgi:type I restriction enzyme, S subunit
MNNVFVTLGEKCRFMGGGTPSRKTPEFFQGDIPWVSVKDFKTSVLQSSEEHISELAISSSATHLIPAGTVLLVTRVGLGKVAIAGCDLTINQDVKAVFPSEDVLPEFLFWFLRSQSENIVRMGAGATVKGVTLEQVKAIQMPLLSNEGQSRIIDILSRAEGIVRLQQQALDRAKALIPALFVELFGDPATNPKGWPVVSLGDLVEEFRYGTSQKADQTGYPVLRIPNVIGDSLSLAAMKFVPLEDAEFGRLRLLDGDVLFVRTNGNPDYVGRCGVFRASLLQDAGLNGDACVYASYLIRARCKSEVLPDYLQTYLQTQPGRSALRERSKTSAGQYNINTEGLASIPVMLATPTKQQEFVIRLADAQSIITQQSTALAKSRELFDALLAKTFTQVGTA